MAIATVGGLGYCPIGSGTLGALAGLAVCAFLPKRWPVQAAWVGVVSLAGLWAATRAEKQFGEKDDYRIVVDETAGMSLAVLMLPWSWKSVGLAFLLFRAFDSAKVWPLRKVEEIGGGFGVMLDDLLAGLMANVVVQALVRLRII